MIQDKLSKLRDNLHLFNQESVGELAYFEKELNNLEADKNFLEMPKIKYLVAYFESVIKTCDDELTSKIDLENNKRIYLFALKNVAAKILTTLSSEENKKALEQLEKDIDLELTKIKYDET